MDRVTDKQLQAIVDRINRMTGSPIKPWSRPVESGPLVSNVGNYHLDHAYGGVSLCRMSNRQGGVSNVLSIGHVPKRELEGLMFAFIKGLEARETIGA